MSEDKTLEGVFYGDGTMGKAMVAAAIARRHSGLLDVGNRGVIPAYVQARGDVKHAAWNRFGRRQRIKQLHSDALAQFKVREIMKERILRDRNRTPPLGLLGMWLPPTPSAVLADIVATINNILNAFPPGTPAPRFFCPACGSMIESVELIDWHNRRECVRDNA